MKKMLSIACAITILTCSSCNEEKTNSAEKMAVSETNGNGGGQASIVDNESAKDIVKLAAGSKDHTTLVTAIKQADLVNSLSNAGPFTVFAPTNAAFDKVDKTTLDNLMKDENKTQLQDILQYHVYVGSLKTEMMTDGQTLNQVNGVNVTIAVKDGKVVVNNAASIINSIPAANGIIHVIDAVLLTPSR